MIGVALNFWVAAVYTAGGGAGVPVITSNELREDGSLELREDGSIELRE